MQQLCLYKEDLSFRTLEAYKTLRSNIEFSGKNIRTITVTNFQKVRIFIVKKIEKLYIPFEAYSLFFLLLHNFFYKINFIGEINGNKILSGGGT